MFDKEAYFCSEEKPHYNYEMMYYYDFPNERKNQSLKYQNISITAKLSEAIEEKIQNYTINIFENNIENVIEQISNSVIEKIQNNITLSVDEAIQQAFSELEVISEEDINNITN